MIYGGGELCYGCGANLTCFLLTQYARTKNYASGAQSYVAYEDQHTFPQSWFGIIFIISKSYFTKNSLRKYF